MIICRLPAQQIPFGVLAGSLGASDDGTLRMDPGRERRVQESVVLSKEFCVAPHRVLVNDEMNGDARFSRTK